MVAFPDSQKRAQAELDAVVGRARAPRVADRAALPYVSAMLRELLRWRTGLPLALPHKTEEDEWYRGMFIPAGTVCFANVIPCNLDPEVSRVLLASLFSEAYVTRRSRWSRAAAPASNR
jgi:cytochrome P450